MHARIENGQPVLIPNKPFVFDGVQYPAQILTLWPRAEKLAVGIYEVERDAVPAGQMATGWTYAVDGDIVRGTPTLEPIPPQPQGLSLDGIAAILKAKGQITSAPAEAAELTIGTEYNPGDTALDGATVYECHAGPYVHSNPTFTPSMLAAHFRIPHVAGDAWVQPTGAHDAYAAGAIVTHNGQTWENTHGDGNIWEPGVFGWAVQ